MDLENKDDFAAAAAAAAATFACNLFLPSFHRSVDST
jgi:hypothetical protein